MYQKQLKLTASVFSSVRAAKKFELRDKSSVLCSAACFACAAKSFEFTNEATEIACSLFSHAAKSWKKRNFILLPYSGKFWNCKNSTVFCSAAQPKDLQNKSTVFRPTADRNFLGLQISTCFCSAAQGKFSGHQQKQLKLTVFHAGKNFNKNRLHFVLAAHRKFLELRTSIAFCSAGLRTKPLSGTSKDFTICEQEHCILLSAAKVLNYEQRHCISFSQAAKSFGIANKSPNVFSSTAQRKSEKVWSLPTKATQINCILFCCVAKILEFVNKSNSNGLYSVLSRSQIFWNCE
jgi:hypothetical protein